MMSDSATAISNPATNLIWIDLEMTGLDTMADRIIEIATIVTDTNLQEIAAGPVIAIHQPDSVLAAMDEWNTRQHRESGLIDRVRSSDVGVEEAEARTLGFLREHVNEVASPMCGNSICQDRRFMARLMPTLEAFFHYRNLDVSTLKLLAQRWAPDVAGGLVKESAHRAQADIRDSIAELAYYRGRLFDASVLRRPS